MFRPTVDQVKVLQKKLELLDAHVVWIDDEGYVLAHTDEERKDANDSDSEFVLDHCHLDLDLRQWPERDLDLPIGWYVVTDYEPDSYSESYPVPRWNFDPLIVTSEIE